MVTLTQTQTFRPEQEATTLARLIGRRQWLTIKSLLTSKSGSAVLVDDPSQPQAVTPDIVVHFAVRFQAPLRILMLLSQRYPESLSSTDVSGRYPIHVACKWSSTPDVIAYLVETNPSVVGVPDSLGKVPMHYVGEYYLQHFTNTLFHREDCMQQVVRLLKMASPKSVNLEDDEGMNAIEYALVSDAPMKVVRTMQRACRDDWRERSRGTNSIDGNGDDAASTGLNPAQLGRRRHNDLVAEMETMALKLQRELSINGKMSNDRIHVHRSRSKAVTRAARTA
mmetsp:Transcript_12740/g.21926  ORF Transcript_12740/g.21926 Transcript_12740/m.21926 type:complete len:281 (-) Transcript_12740:141-983(-)